MDVYTANQLQAIVDFAYRRGIDDARTRHDDQLTPPRLEEIVLHSFKGGLYENHATDRQQRA